MKSLEKIKFLAKAIAIYLKMYNNGSIKSSFNCTKYLCLVQDLKGKKRIFSQMIKELSEIPGIKLPENPHITKIVAKKRC